MDFSFSVFEHRIAIKVTCVLQYYACCQSVILSLKASKIEINVSRLCERGTPSKGKKRQKVKWCTNASIEISPTTWILLTFPSLKNSHGQRNSLLRCYKTCSMYAQDLHVSGTSSLYVLLVSFSEDNMVRK